MFRKNILKAITSNYFYFFLTFLMLCSLVVYGQQISIFGRDSSFNGDIHVGSDMLIAGEFHGYTVPTEVTWTNATRNGNFGGYQAMNSWIQQNGCYGYHVCDGGEIARYQQHHGLIGNMPPSWFHLGVAAQYSGGAAHDCHAWTSAASTVLGAVTRNVSGSIGPSWNWCNSLMNVACCKY